jgi:hypothetical protein
MKIKIQALLLSLAVLSYSCTDNDDKEIVEPVGPQLIVKFKFDPTQARLDNFGNPSTVAVGNAAQSPTFNTISSHYLELAPNANTALGAGKILYHAPETMAGGTKGIDFSKAKIVGEDEVFLSIPLKDVAVGSYEWVRCSLAYQNYDINVWSSGANYVGTLASFVGFRTYIKTHKIDNYSFAVNGNRDQGYWAFGLKGFTYSSSGQAPAGATTVPNPISGTSPIPAGSCVVTGKFADHLVITGNETKNVVVTLSLSINNSFEWHEVSADGKYEPAAGENVVDMGLRGLVPTYVK